LGYTQSVEAAPRRLKLYTTRDGQAPFLDWLNALKDLRARAVIRTRLDRVEIGNFGDCKLLGEGVSELRIDFGPGYRAYFGRQGKDLVLLLCGGIKASQAADIARARQYWSDYRSRGHA